MFVHVMLALQLCLYAVADLLRPARHVLRAVLLLPQCLHHHTVDYLLGCHWPEPKQTARHSKQLRARMWCASLCIVFVLLKCAPDGLRYHDNRVRDGRSLLFEVRSDGVGVGSRLRLVSRSAWDFRISLHLWRFAFFHHFLAPPTYASNKCTCSNHVRLLSAVAVRSLAAVAVLWTADNVAGGPACDGDRRGLHCGDGLGAAVSQPVGVRRQGIKLITGRRKQ